MNEHCTDLKLIEGGPEDSLWYYVVSPPVPFVSDRDNVVRAIKTKVVDGHFQITRHSVESELCPEVKGKVRAEVK